MKKLVLCLLFVSVSVKASGRRESACDRLAMKADQILIGCPFFICALVTENLNVFSAWRVAQENLKGINWGNKLAPREWLYGPKLALFHQDNQEPESPRSVRDIF